MSFDFGSNDQSASDPTADFLARERSAAGALGGDSDLFSQPSAASGGGDKDFAASAAAFPSLDGEESSTPINTTTTQQTDGGDGGWGEDDLGFGSANQPTTTTSTANANTQSEVSQFENKFPQLDDEEEELDMGKGSAPIASVSKGLRRERLERSFLTLEGYVFEKMRDSSSRSASSINRKHIEQFQILEVDP